MTQPNPLTLADEARDRAEVDAAAALEQFCNIYLADNGFPGGGKTWLLRQRLGRLRDDIVRVTSDAHATAITALAADLAASRAEVATLRAGWFRMMQFDSECAPEIHFGKRCEGKDTCRCAEEMDEWMAPAKFPIPDPAP